jgi:hypothetical protein
LAGAFIAFGAMFYTAVMAGVDPGFGPARLLGGVAFSLGLILVIVAGAELFTGNNLIAIAWADGRIGTASLERDRVWLNRREGFPRLGISDSRCWLGLGASIDGETLFEGSTGSCCGFGGGGSLVPGNGGAVRG